MIEEGPEHWFYLDTYICIYTYLLHLQFGNVSTVSLHLVDFDRIRFYVELNNMKVPKKLKVLSILLVYALWLCNVSNLGGMNELFGCCLLEFLSFILMHGGHWSRTE